MNHAAEEAISKADAELNNVGLPNYSMLFSTMSYLLSQAKLSDIGERNCSVLKAEEMRDQFIRVMR